MSASQKDPFLSVVMPLFNKQREVDRAISSVLGQQRQDFELIIVNDGSTDASAARAAAWADPRIRLFHQENQGVSAARNRGIAAARSDLVAFLDADDEWLPGFLTAIGALHAAHGECGVLATSYFIRRGTQAERLAILRGLPAGFSGGVLPDYFRVAAASDPPVWSSAVAVRKKLLLEIGGFPAGVIAGEDLLTWARLAVRTSIAYCPRPLARFHAPDAMSDRPARVPQQPDAVGRGLLAVLAEAPAWRRPGLTEYLSLWHRMRAVVFLKLDRGREARQELGEVRKYGGKSARLAAFYLLSWLPGRLSSTSYRALTRLLSGMRRLRSRRMLAALGRSAWDSPRSGGSHR